MNGDSSAIQDTTNQDQLETSMLRSKQAWQRLWLRIRSVTPGGLMRFFLLIGALAALVWLISVAWLALTPFVIGAVIAYILLPVVNRLDRWLPRWLATLLTLGAALLFVGAFLALLVPALADQLVRLYLILPSLDELRNYVDRTRQFVQTLPEPTQQTINDVLQQAGAAIRENLDSYLVSLVDTLILSTLSVVNTVGFILGFLIIPAWLLTVLKDQQHGVRALNRLLPGWLAPDFWAVLRIFDRTFRAFINGQFLLGVVVGLGMYLGLSLLEFFGWPVLQYKLLLSILLGLLQLIPSLGPFLGIIPAFMFGLFPSLENGLIILGLYLLVLWLVNRLVVPRIERNVVDIHPAILIVIIVALSELGFWWVLLAAPITTVVRDLFRYVYGRFSEPPRPAGVLPGEPIPAGSEVTQLPSASRLTPRVPLVYQRTVAARQPNNQ